jgi:hypothetical protein
MQHEGLNLIEIIHQGAIATYPLILMSIISLRHADGCGHYGTSARSL